MGRRTTLCSNDLIENCTIIAKSAAFCSETITGESYCVYNNRVGRGTMVDKGTFVSAMKMGTPIVNKRDRICKRMEKGVCVGKSVFP